MNTWAVIKTGAKQYKVSEGQTLEVEKIAFKDNKQELVFSEVLLVKNDRGLVIGEPLIDKAKVKAKVVKNFKGKKIRVVKFKPKSKYLRTRGHRQPQTSVLIEKIVYN